MTDKKKPSGGPPAPPATASVALADTAYIFGTVVGSTQSLETLMAGLQARLEALRDPLAPEALDELKRHLPVLDALFLRFAAEAAQTRKGSVHQSLLLRAALQAQQAHARTFALLHTLAVQAKASTATAIELHDAEDDRSDE